MLETLPGRDGKAFPVLGTEAFYSMMEFVREGFLEVDSVQGLTAYLAVDKLHGCDFIPRAF